MDSDIDKVLFGVVNFRNREAHFGIKQNDRRRHMYIIGKTGMGKSELQKNIAIQDIQAGRGIAMVDAHGEVTDALLDYIPKERINDVIYINPADVDFPIAFNVMEQAGDDKRHLIADGVMGVFKKVWEDTWSARMEYILHNTILALLETDDATLLGINRMYSDKDYRARVIEQVTDPVVKAFWTQEFAKYTERFAAEATPAIQNKVGQFISSLLIRNIIGQTKSTFDFRQAMDEEKIILVNLSKGKVGEEASRLIGSMIITKLQLAAMSRANIPEHERKDFTLMEEEVRDAVFGNIGTLVTFRVGAEDAEFLEKEFAPDFTANDIVNLAFRQIYLKLTIDGVTSNAFSAMTMDTITKPVISYREEVIAASRAQYAHPRAEVEEVIAKWTQLPGAEQKFQEGRGRSNGFQREGNVSIEMDNRPNPAPRAVIPLRKPTVVPVSLSEALRSGPVDFHGKSINRPEGGKPAQSSVIRHQPALRDPAKSPAKINELRQLLGEITGNKEENKPE